MSVQTISIKGTDIRDLGLVVETVGDRLTGLQRSYEYTAVPGYMGGVASRVPTVPSRRVSFSTLARDLTTNQRRALINAVHDVITVGLNEIVFHGDDDLVLYGTYSGSPVEVISPGLMQYSNVRIRFELDCHNAAKYERQVQMFHVEQSPVEIPLGTLPSLPIVHLRSTDPAINIDYRHPSGILLHRFTLQCDWEANEWLRVDFGKKQITHVSSSGVQSDAYGWKDPDTPWFSLDPGDGTRSLNVWPTLSVSSGSATVFVRRAYEA